MTLSREHIMLPDRQEGETSMQFLARVEDVVPRSQIPSILSKNTDDFLHAVMRSFMRKFGFFGDPLDMALRKLLMEVDLPKETQQIDRVLQSFADRYHECNPGIFSDSGASSMLVM
jgi:Sec7-like guanine-nucleotide exchange factor